MSRRSFGYGVGWRGGEPTLADALSDPLTRALMEADGVDPEELEADLRDLSQSLAQRGGSFSDGATSFSECGSLEG
jgi:hypothetical protein